MELKDKNKLLWKVTEKYFYDLIEENKDKLGKYKLDWFFEGDNKDYKSISDVYDRLLHSSQNYQHMPNTIKYEQNKAKIKKILFDFDLNKIASLNPKELYYVFRDEFNVNSKDTRFNAWLKYSHSAIDSAKFLKEFKNLKDFENFVKMFNYNIHTRVALPLLIDEKINGIGFALACDFLKELGFTSYSKPDVHIKDVFSALELSGTDNLSVFEAVDRMATDNDETPYKIDKIIWTICSGDFYFANGRKGVKIGPHKKQLIKMLKSKLKETKEK